MNREEYYKAYYQKNKDKIKKASKKWKEEHPEEYAEWKRDNKESILQNQRNWRETNNDRYMETQRKWKLDNKDRNKCHELQRLYGITLKQYTKLLTEQSGVCCICGNFNSQGRSLSVDHDHSTGEVRGLLCDLCNRGLGYFKDNSILLNKAAEYLNSYIKEENEL